MKEHTKRTLSEPLIHWFFSQISRTGGYFIQIFFKKNLFKNPETRGSAILEILKTHRTEGYNKIKEPTKNC
jgi:hypothetical protein